EQVTQAATDLYEGTSARKFFGEKSLGAVIVPNLQRLLFRSPLVGCFSVFVYPIRVVILYEVDIGPPRPWIRIKQSAPDAFYDPADLSYTRLEQY
ncbi:MAG TPA: hypothetical protein VGN30_19585, partial [Steroidobacteraceae bacterium]